MKWQLRSLRGIIMQWCIMGNYAAIMSHLTTSSIYETLAWVALLWKLLSCRRSSLLTFTRNATQLAMLRQNQWWFHNFFNVIFREFSSFNHATFFDAVSRKGLQNILLYIFLEFHLKIKENHQNATFWGTLKHCANVEKDIFPQQFRVIMKSWEEASESTLRH